MVSLKIKIRKILNQNTERRKTDLGMMFRQLHVVEYPEENLEQVAPPVRPECIAVSLDDFKENSEGSSAHVQFAATHDTRELEQ